MKLQSLFQPCITIDDDGTINVDWGSSYVNTVDVDNPALEILDDDPHKHAAKLDAILGITDGASPAERLRRLAAAVEGSK